MRLITAKVDENAAYVLPIGDLHVGDKVFKGVGKDKLLANLEWTRHSGHPVKIILMGDIFNIAGRSAKTSPFESDPNEIFEAEELFAPYADLIIGAIRGNHENRVRNEFGYDPLQLMCKHLDIPYAGSTGVFRLQVGKRPDGDTYWQTYHIAAHHSTGGGGSLGNALNSAAKLERMVANCDAYLIGHNHQLVNGVREVYYPSQSGMKLRRVHYVSCGSYLTHDGSYAEDAMMPPSKLGSPRIRLSGIRDNHDVHISI